MSSKPIISAVIVNYNAGHLLRQCIASIVYLDEIIIVDNASRDSSMMESENQFQGKTHIKFIYNASNLGFSTACNIGFKHATGDYIFFLNPDCSVNECDINALCDALADSPNAGMVGGQLIREDGTAQGGARRTLPTPWRAFVRAFGLYRLQKYFPNLFRDFHLHNQPLPLHPMEVESISGACMLVKREAIVDVGLLDESYFMHCEDLDWCFRFNKNKWKVLFQPAARVHHKGGACSASRPFFVEWHKHRGMLIFYKKFFYYQYPRVLMGVVVAGVCLHFILIILTIWVKDLFREKHHAS